MHRRLAAAATLCLAVLLAACTHNAPQPPPPPSAVPEIPTASPTSVDSSSPSPSDDPEAAITAAIKKAYESQFAELNRLDQQGGTTKLTPILLQTTSGQHRRNVVSALSGDKKSGVHQVGSGHLLGISVGEGTSSKRPVTACEDYSDASWLKSDGSKLNVKQPLRYLQHATVKKGNDQHWRVDYIRTSTVKKFRLELCDGDKA